MVAHGELPTLIGSIFHPVIFNRWLADVWDFFVKQKLKNARRKFSGRRVKSEDQRTPTPAPKTRQSSFISPSSPLLSKRSRSSLESPNPNATLLNPTSSPEFEDQMIDVDSHWTIMKETSGSNEVQPFTPRPFSASTYGPSNPHRLQKNPHPLGSAHDSVFDTPSPPAQKRVKGTNSQVMRTSASLPTASASASATTASGQDIIRTIAFWIDFDMVSTTDIRGVIDTKVHLIIFMVNISTRSTRRNLEKR
jgi:hypothetical protein